MELNEQIRVKIIALMEQKEYSVPQLAKKAGVNKNTLYHHLNGVTEIKMTVLAAISPVLGITDMSYWYQDDAVKEVMAVKRDDAHKNCEIERIYLNKQIKILNELVQQKEMMIQRLLSERKTG
jgi:DNA-binding XRE family transcriptional regulator